MAYRIFRAEEIGSYGRADNRDAITRIQVSLTDEGARCNNKRPDIKVFRGDAIDGSVPVFIAVDDLVGTVYSRRHIIYILDFFLNCRCVIKLQFLSGAGCRADAAGVR